MAVSLNQGNLRPGDYIAAAKERAYKCRHQAKPKLTALEKSFWLNYRKAPPCTHQ